MRWYVFPAVVHQTKEQQELKSYGQDSRKLLEVKQ